MSTTQVTVRNKALLTINESLAALKAIKNGVTFNMASISPETRYEPTGLVPGETGSNTQLVELAHA